jgi:hypothetical protein
MHSFLAATVLKKPLIIEEFGLTWFKKTLDQQRVLFKVGRMGAAHNEADAMHDLVAAHNLMR